MEESRAGIGIVESAPVPLGKISSSAFDRIIKPGLGATRADVLVGPQNGIDCGIVDIGNGMAMALTTDPFFVMPEYGWERAAWFAVNIVASDAWTSALEPRYAAIDLNLPLDMPDADLEALWTCVDRTCRDIGLALVTGHTGRYEGCAYPMLGAATIACIGPRDQYVTPAMAAVGDAVIITKGAAIETAGIFGATFPRYLSAAIGHSLARRAEELFWQMSVVADCRAAVTVGVRDQGVTCLHDATERGIWGGLTEIAEASQVGMLVDQEAIPILPEVRAICDLASIDPYSTSSEGTLLLTCRPRTTGAIIRRLADAGILATQIGEVTPVMDGVRVVRCGQTGPLTAPESDPFWPAFRRAGVEWVER